jgi:phosphoenolpyruvate synthase/pyruvate phosphate dikinase
VTLLTLDQAAALQTAEVGGKARGLASLAALGLPVPEAIVVPAAVHARWLRDGALGADTQDTLWQAASRLGRPLAVRSSAADEDGSARSAAGQYESVMDVRDPDGLAAAIAHCYQAADGTRASAYRGGDVGGADGRSGSPRVALVIQREIESQRAGVAFSVDPVSGSRERVVIEAVFGHGEGIVSGVLDPDRYLVARDGGEVRARVADKAASADGRGAMPALVPERRLARVLRDHEARAVAELVLRAEEGVGAPVDVEFCFAGETLWLLQCRPITALQ